MDGKHRTILLSFKWTENTGPFCYHSNRRKTPDHFVIIQSDSSLVHRLTGAQAVNIGVLFDERSLHLRPLLDQLLAEGDRDNVFTLRPHIFSVDITDSFAVSNAMCDLITKEVIAIIGVTNTSSLSTIQSYSNTYHMPFISIGSAPSFSPNSRFQLFVRPSYMGAVVDLLHYYGCRKAVYIYDSDEGLMRIQDLFQSLNSRDLPLDLDVRRVSSLAVAKTILGTLLSGDHVIKDANNQKIFSIMDLEMLNVLDLIRVLEKDRGVLLNLNIIAVSLDLVPVLLSHADLSSTNISGFQLVSTTSTDRTLGLTNTIPPDPLKSTEALLYDAMESLLTAMRSIERINPGWLELTKRETEGIQVKCTNFVVDRTPHGVIFMQYLKQVQFEGQTGYVKFDALGRRTNFSVDVFRSTHGEPNNKMGVWYEREGLHLSINTHIEKTTILLINNTRPIHIVDMTYI